MTVVNAIEKGKDVNVNELAREVMENATGIPIDMIVKTNIDFMQGAEGLPGIFDSLFPDGLEINVAKEIVDESYPVGYDTQKIVFHKGIQKMDGKNLTIYGRTRHTDLDFGRSERQRQVAQASMRALFPSIMGDLIGGDTKTLDKLVSTLEQQKNSSNLFYDVDLIEIVKTLRDNLTRLRSTPQGIAVLGVLIANTKPNIESFISAREGMFTSFGLGYGDSSYSLVNAGYEGSTYKLAGSSINSPPILYWDSLRKRIIELYQ